MLILNKWCAFFNPEQFQGWGRKRRYFEGWYYKLVNADETRALAVIPGIAMDETEKKQAFIQVLDGRKHTSQYFRFDAEQFRPQARKFQFSIAGNHFSADTIHLELPALSGELHFSGMVPWPKHGIRRELWALMLRAFYGMLPWNRQYGSQHRRESAVGW